ncbi:MAG: NAD(+)/NADH kinase [Bacillota bacterium]|jgi:NAD+ kinase
MAELKSAMLIINYKKPESIGYAKQVIEYLSTNHIDFVFPGEDIGYELGYSAKDLSTMVDDLKKKKKSEYPDFAIILGGDGTIIHAARVLSQFDIPLFGINLGQLGFLTAIEKANLKEKLEKFVSGNYVIEERMLLYAEVVREGKIIINGSAQNDVVINNDISRTIEANLSIDDHHAMSYVGDGLILATPTGSTAYSLSAGGPILVPNAENIIVTPISAHNLYARPIITDGNSRVTVSFGFKNSFGKITFDGQSSYQLEPKDLIVISKCQYKSKFIWIEESTFFDNLHKKLGSN